MTNTLQDAKDMLNLLRLTPISQFNLVYKSTIHYLIDHVIDQEMNQSVIKSNRWDTPCRVTMCELPRSQTTTLSLNVRWTTKMVNLDTP